MYIVEGIVTVCIFAGSDGANVYFISGILLFAIMPGIITSSHTEPRLLLY